MEVAKQPLIERPYDRGTRKLDIAGERYGMLVAREHVGFRYGSMSFWRFDCDCGATCVKSAARVRWSWKIGDPQNICHCGCRSKLKYTGGLSQTAEYKLWKNIKPRLCRAWQDDFLDFKAECLDFRNAKWLLANNRELPIGPGNFHWAAHPEKVYDLIEKCIQVLIGRGMTRQEATARTWKISRQRRSQLIARAEGVCPFCFQPAMPGFCMCETCNDKHNAQKRRLNKKKQILATAQ